MVTIPLDFGEGVFTGSARWLEIAVRANGGVTFTPLSPRQPLLPTPCALYAPNAGEAATASAVTPGAVTGPGIATGQVVRSLSHLPTRRLGTRPRSVCDPPGKVPRR